LKSFILTAVISPFFSYRFLGGRRGSDRMVVQCLSPPRLRVHIPLGRVVLDTTLCDKICQGLAAGQWFSPVSSTNKTDRHDITEILLKVALNTITLTLTNF